ncbi:MAG: transposase domain-containing protein [Marinagarivorans sp.]|nr:transposase domain-containing protein [Marinagarivorans sp.]
MAADVMKRQQTLEPRHYIEYLLTELPKRKVGDDVKDLLPWMVKLGVVS